jgi:hypothetical protein
VYVAANERDLMHENGQLRIMLRECIGMFHRIRRHMEDMNKTQTSLTLTHAVLQTVKPEAEKLVDYKNIAEADTSLLGHLWDTVKAIVEDLNLSKTWLLTPDLQDDESLVRLLRGMMTNC